MFTCITFTNDIVLCIGSHMWERRKKYGRSWTTSNPLELGKATTNAYFPILYEYIPTACNHGPHQNNVLQHVTTHPSSAITWVRGHTIRVWSSTYCIFNLPNITSYFKNLKTKTDLEFFYFFYSNLRYHGSKSNLTIIERMTSRLQIKITITRWRQTKKN